MNEITTTSGNLMETANNAQYCSFKPTTAADKTKLFNAIMNPDEKLKDHVNEVIAVKEIIVEMVDLEKKDNAGKPITNDYGEVVVETAPRIVLIDDKGVSFTATSVGVFSALKRIIGIFGEPGTWEKPIKVKPKLINKGDRSMLNLEIVK